MKIKNTKQYYAVKKKIRDLESVLHLTEADLAKNPDVPSDVRVLMTEDVKNTIAELKEQIAEVDALQTVSSFSVKGFSSIGEAMIKARMARGYSQEDLAVRVGTSQQNIHEYESDDYSRTSLANICKIAAALEIEIEANIILRCDDLTPTVVIVDDEMAVCKSIERVFQRESPGINVLIATSIHEFKEILELHKPDMVVTDLLMGDNSHAGLEVAEMTRSASKTATVVILTANSDALDGSRADQAGVKEVVDKFGPATVDPCNRVLEIANSLIRSK